jgi:hypothetical protein
MKIIHPSYYSTPLKMVRRWRRYYHMDKSLPNPFCAPMSLTVPFVRDISQRHHFDTTSSQISRKSYRFSDRTGETNAPNGPKNRL